MHSRGCDSRVGCQFSRVFCLFRCSQPACLSCNFRARFEYWEYRTSFGTQHPRRSNFGLLGRLDGYDIWLVKGYMDTIPRDIDESAHVDALMTGKSSPSDLTIDATYPCDHWNLSFIGHTMGILNGQSAAQ